MRIERLTPDQEALLPVVRDEWLAHGLSTERANRPEAERGVRLAYEAAGLEPPPFIFWMDSPYAAAWAQALAPEIIASAAVGGANRAQVGDQVWDQVRDQVGAQVRAQVRDQVRDQVWAQAYKSAWGQHDTWLSFYAFFRRLNLTGTERLAGLMRVAESAGWWWPFAGAVILTERPTQIHRDQLGRLHCETGPALLYPDGWGFHAWHGVRVPAWVVDSPTVQQIAQEPNAEIRRCGIESLGWDQFIQDAQLRPWSQ